MIVCLWVFNSWLSSVLSSALSSVLSSVHHDVIWPFLHNFQLYLQDSVFLNERSELQWEVIHGDVWDGFLTLKLGDPFFHDGTVLFKTIHLLFKELFTLLTLAQILEYGILRDFQLMDTHVQFFDHLVLARQDHLNRWAILDCHLFGWLLRHLK